MTRVAYISPSACLDHDTGLGHPERIERLSSINEYLKVTGIDQDLKVYKARKAKNKELSRAHLDGHIGRVTNLIKNGAYYLDGDTTVCKKSLKAAYLAAGSALTAVDLMSKGKEQRIFCGVRPPGHHAEDDKAMGFCIFNNVAVAAQYAIDCGLAKRVLIIDWDVHHGNGTQQIFEKSSSVFYYSIHQYPFYPGTGGPYEVGIGDGHGFTLNRAMPAHSTEEAYLKHMDADLDDIGKRFGPDLIFISAGFDAHELDPLGSMNLSTAGFGRLTDMVVGLANSYSDGRIVSVLEGGYNLGALSESVVAHLRGLQG